MKLARLVLAVLVTTCLGACEKAPPAVPATAAPEPVPAMAPPDAHVVPAAVPDAAAPPALAPPLDAAPAPAPAAPAAAKPRAPAADPLYACAGDGDCTLLWLGRGCLPSDPVAVARAHFAEARKKLSKGPPLACGIGGQQYDADRRAIEMRYGVTCKAKTCTLVDRGPQPSTPGF